MLAGRAWKFGTANRSVLLLIPVSALLLASVSWNVWQYRLDRDRRAQAKEAERSAKAAVALVKEEANRARLRKQARDAESDARIQQLYKEINNLTRASEGILLPRETTRTIPSTTDGPEKKADVP
jgi:hypothetical protein